LLKRQSRRNPLWFNIVAIIVGVVQFSCLFFMENYYYRSGSQFVMALFLVAYGFKERKINPLYTAVFYFLAIVFVYLSWQTIEFSHR
jgi:hypothetical protein